jgi:hypothetical protein
MVHFLAQVTLRAQPCGEPSQLFFGKREFRFGEIARCRARPSCLAQYGLAQICVILGRAADTVLTLGVLLRPISATLHIASSERISRLSPASEVPQTRNLGR